MSRPDRRGFTLVETCIVLGVAAVLFMMGWPKVRQLLVQSDVKSARAAVIALYQQARTTALQNGRPTTIWMGSSKLWVTAKPKRNGGTGTYDTLGTIQNLSQRFGVTVTATPDSFVDLNARGLGLTSNNTTTVIAFSKAGFQDTVRINQIGRVSK